MTTWEEHEEKLRKQAEALMEEHELRMETDPEYKKDIERKQAYVSNNSEIQEMLAKVKEGQKWKHLPIGSPEAKAKGCVCVDEIRSDECYLHAFTVGDQMKAKFQMNKALKEDEDT